MTYISSLNQIKRKISEKIKRIEDVVDKKDYYVKFIY